MTGRVLILGKNGQVGRHLVRQFPDAIAWGRENLDLSDSSTIDAKIRAVSPSWVINASAYTAVDKAESEEALALQVNGLAVGEIAKTCAEIDARLVHFSTDYVFDGAKDTAYIESDKTNPINAYGRTKLVGEQQIQANCQLFWIFRTSWVFSEHSPNFLKTMVRLGREHSEVQVVADQFGKPTYAGELARIAVCLVEGKLELIPGIHHLSCPDTTTWFDFAAEIFARAELEILNYKSPKVIPVSSADYVTIAKRPRNSVLESSADIGVMQWRDFISRCLS